MILSKSKLLAFRQCPKRLWLEVNRPELREDAAASQAAFSRGHDVGSLARRLYDPMRKGTLIDVGADGIMNALARTRERMEVGEGPIFEAGFSAAGAVVFADVLLPVRAGALTAWRMVEVKSTGKVKDYQRDDAAIQHYVATQAGVRLEGIAVACVNTSWVYPGGDDYGGILTEHDVTKDASSRHTEVRKWIADAVTVAASDAVPARLTGAHCRSPFDCGFLRHCESQEPAVEFPVTWLPRIMRRDLAGFLAQPDVRSMDQVPDELLNDKQRRVKEHTLAGTTYFDANSAAAAVGRIPLPALFLDFETIAFAVPVWAGTRPYQQIPFQYSLHRLAADGSLNHHAFLDLSGNDPSRALADCLVRECDSGEPVFAYNKGFEEKCIRELAGRFEDLREPLLCIASRLVDLLPIVRQSYYNPIQQGSWGLKAVLSALVPELSYQTLEGVKDGHGAQVAYSQAVHHLTTPERKAQIKQQLLDYCRLDTASMVYLRRRLVE